ncbi:MAG: hypothetical protein AAF846_00765 [Chloroflexota bacterium]
MRRLLSLSMIVLIASLSIIAYQIKHPEPLTIQTDTVTFTSSHRHIMPSQCPTITWDVTHVDTISLNNVPVSAKGSIVDCLDTLTQPILIVGGNTYRLPIEMLHARIDIFLLIGLSLMSLLGIVLASVHLFYKQKSISAQIIETTIFIYTSIVFIIWSLVLIFNSSVIALDGTRYYALFDDALITMRYAENLIEGNGAVWNIGERVEGYSNPLWLLVMSGLLLITDKITAVLFVQILGSLPVLITAGIATRIINYWLSNYPNDIRSFARIMTFILMLWGNYAFTYYALMGMESSLQVLLLMAALHYSVQYRGESSKQDLLIISSCIGLSYLTHPDTLILIIPFGLYLLLMHSSYKKNFFQNTFLLTSVAFFIWWTHLAIRYLYYGELVSNVALYKSGLAFSNRLSIGVDYLSTSLQPYSLILIIVAIGLLFNFRRFKLGLLLIVLVQLIYQGIIRGDFPPLAQYLHFSLMCLLLLAIYDITHLLHTLSQRMSENQLSTSIRHWGIAFSAIAILVIATNWDYKRQLVFLSRPSYVFEYEVYINQAVALNHILTEQGSVGVIWAGTIPYYTNAQAYDFFGRTDPVVAQTSPNDNMGFFLSGVNKTSLLHSIIEQQPDYIASCRLLTDDVCHLIEGDYAYYVYQNRVGLLLRVGSSNILWEQFDER